ncbi:MAG: hypothetical protein WEA56_13675 [Balneolaceae bacterium]
MNGDSNLPPQPPEITRKIFFSRAQIAGMVLIFLLPVLALSGILESRMGQVRSTETGVVIEVEYPAVLRFKKPASLHIIVQNNLDHDIQGFRSNIDRHYLSNFSQLSFIPAVTEVTSGAYSVELTEVEAGESRMITIEFEPEHIGYISGFISFSGSGAGETEVSFRTFVLP